MATRKRNEFLEDLDLESEEDLGPSDSEDQDTRARAVVGRTAKRQKTERDSESDESEDDIFYESSGRVAPDGDFITAVEATQRASHVPDEQPNGGRSAILDDRFAGAFDDDDDDEDYLREVESEDDVLEEDDEELDQERPTVKPAKSSLAKKLAKSALKTKKSGVVYLSRIPPHMKPFVVKRLLEQHAPTGLNRIFLTPETADRRKSRLKAGGNKRKNFTDGWVEFNSKREAKHAVELLNTKTIGGKKGGKYHDDVWNLKYLKGGFKWSHLTEQIANENAERTSRVRAEDAKERRAVREFLGNVEKGKMVEGMERKAEAKAAREDAEMSTGAPSARKIKEPRRTFAQVKVVQQGRSGTGNEPAERAKRVLSGIF